MTQLNRTIAGCSLLTFTFMFGCGGSGTPVAENSQSQTAAESVTQTEAKVDTSKAMDVVSRFLDSVRRGGTDTEAISLVTTKAREEFQRTGRVLQPLGSPSAKFEVTRSEPLPGQQEAAFVHTLWTEPNEEGVEETSEVVWAVQLEEGKWRISGMVIGEATGARPWVIDFENGDSLARMFEPEPAEPEGESVLQATLPADAGLPVDAGPSVLR